MSQGFLKEENEPNDETSSYEYKHVCLAHSGCVEILIFAARKRLMRRIHDVWVREDHQSKE